MDTTDIAILEGELAAARISWKTFAIKSSLIRTPKNDSQVGWGGYATVHRATLRKPAMWWIKVPVAIKKLSVPEDREGRLRVALALLQELKIWALLRHPNIIAFRGFHINDTLDEMWLISDLAIHGNLLIYLESGYHPLLERLVLAKDTASGIGYLHTRTPPVCHGDIKSLNVLIGTNKRGLICDFGTAREEPLSQAQGTTKLYVGGTTRYSSPELFEEGNSTGLTTASDVWSWGCLCHEIVTGLGPYNDVAVEAQVIHRISMGVLPASLDTADYPDVVRELLRRCWQINPDQRPVMSECLDALRGAIIQNSRKGHSLEPAEFSLDTDANLDQLEIELNEVLAPFTDYRIEPSTITFPPSGGVVGSGGYGVIYQATMCQQGITNQVAVKKLRANGGRERHLRMLIAVIREVRVWVRLDHPNILPFVGFYVPPNLNEAWLVSSSISSVDLGVFLQQSTPNDEVRLELARDTARGLEYLHGLSICHGDVKSSNVLVTRDERAILCEYRLTRSIENMPTGLTTSTFEQAGTLAYQSPELILGRSRRSLQSDVWAWGCLLHEIFTGKPPYHWANNAGVIVKGIITDVPPGTLHDLPFYIRRLLSFCWLTRMSLRPTMRQCIDILSADMSQSPIFWDNPENSMRMRLMRSEVDFRMEDILGTGLHGTVYQGTITRQGSGAIVKVAVKVLHPTDSDEGHERLFREIGDIAADWDGLHHPNILRFFGFSIDTFGVPEVLLVSPLVDGGNLSDYLKHELLNYEGKLDLVKGIVQGLLYLHTRDPPLCHGNLHSRNVLLNEKGDAMLNDYGLVGAMDKVGIEINSLGDIEASSRYWSPGVKAGMIRGTRDDVWSLGCVLLEIITGRIPYDGVEDIPAVVDDLDCPPHIQNLLGLCWQKDQNLRPTVREIATVLDGELFWRENVCNITTDGVRHLKLSYDGTRLAVAYELRVEVYSTDDGKRLSQLRLPGKYGNPRCLHFSRSGRYLVAGTTEGLLVWDVEAERILSSIFRRHGCVYDADVSWDDAMIASVPSDGTVRLSNMKDLKRERQIVPHKKATLVAFSSTSDIVAIGFKLGGLQILNVETGANLAILEGSGTAFTLFFSSDGGWLCEGSEEGIQTWDASQLVKLSPEVALHDKPIYAVSISPGDSGTVAFIDATSAIHVRVGYSVGSTVNRVTGTLPASSMPALRDIRVSADGSGIAVASPELRDQVRIDKFGPHGSLPPYGMGNTNA